jgi:GT2 family glycosyltransferase
MTLITLCTPTHNRKNDVERFLASVAALRLDDLDVDVIVVDDASTDGTADLVRRCHPEVRVISLDTNVGPARARNVAISECRTPYVAFFDSDAELRPDWLAGAVGHLDANTILAGKVVRPDGSTEWGPRRAAFWGGSYRTTVDRANAGSSCNLVVPVALAKKVGGFREDFRVYFEDTEFCIRARIAGGGAVRYVDDIEVVHHHHSMNTPAREFLFWRNKVRGMMDIHRGPVPRLAFLLVSILIAFQHLARPRTFVASLRGYFRGLRDWLRKGEDT